MTEQDVQPVFRLAFDATFDEFVDVVWRTTTASGVHRRARKQGPISGALACVIVLLALLYADGTLSQLESARDWIALLAGGLAIGLVCAWLFGWLHDRQLWKNCRRFAEETNGGTAPFSCTFEIYPDTLRIQQRGVRTSLDWSTARDIGTEAGDMVLRFASYYIVIRERAFSSAAHREQVVGYARERAGLLKAAIGTTP